MNDAAQRERISEVAQASIHMMATGDRADFDELIHPHAINREASQEPPECRGRGPAAFWATAQWLRTAWSDMSFTIDELVIEGDLAVTHGTMSGRHTGSLVVWRADGTIERAFPATGKTFEVHHCHFQRVLDGKVHEHWAVRDDQGAAMQLGWIPPTPWFLWRCARATSNARREHRRSAP